MLRTYFISFIFLFAQFLLRASSNDVLYERCTSVSAEPREETSDSVCYDTNGTDTRFCSGITNWASCLREATKHLERPAAKIARPAPQHFTYDKRTRTFCYQPQLEVGESTRSFRGFVLNEVYIGKHPENDFTLGCIFQPDFEITREILNETFCCTQLPQEWGSNEDTYFEVNGNSIPYTIGDQQIHSDFIRLGDVASTPFAKDPPSSSENQLRKYMYILIALLVFVVLIVSVIVVNRVKLNQCRSDATKAVQDFLRRAELFVRPGMTQSEGPGQNNAGHNLHQQTGTQEENV
ncbi:uncharacterized protein LOC134857316 [Symsagittifera roscoffensis]|uniref:uncharacterized protein LOC134857316 n=1 Tax=Symsagittifera roscoffensis TaxID=84072 RepID=UPI00307B9B60